MGANRPPAVQKKAYVEIDLELLNSTGELKAVGEPIIAPTITTKVPRGKFEVTYTAELFSIMRDLGNKKIQVLSYLLDNKDGNNSLNKTNKQIADEVGVSRPTVIDTMKILEDAGLATRENSVVMISPHLMVKGSQLREAWLMRKYVEMTEMQEQYVDAIDVNVEDQYSFTNEGEIIQKAR